MNDSDQLMNTIDWELLQKRCYVPYSGRKEVCVVKGESGFCYPGVRIENVTFPLVMDAIQVALFSCLSEGDQPVAVFFPGQIHDDGLNADNNASETGKRVIMDWCDRFGLKPVYLHPPDEIASGSFFHTKEKQDSFDRLQDLTTRCCVPYSGFPVSAIIKTDQGYFSGVNIETDDWQKGLCAERVALGKAVSAGARSFSEILVYAPESEYTSPCGSCRQVLVEWMRDGVILLHHNETERTRLFIQELLPYQFKAGNAIKKRVHPKNTKD